MPAFDVVVGPHSHAVNSPLWWCPDVSIDPGPLHVVAQLLKSVAGDGLLQGVESGWDLLLWKKRQGEHLPHELEHAVPLAVVHLQKMKILNKRS